MLPITFLLKSLEVSENVRNFAQEKYYCRYVYI